MWPAQIKDEWKQVPAGDVILQIMRAERVNQSAARGNATTEVATEQLYMVVVEPDNYEGIEHKQIFWIGSDQDPLAVREETTSRGGASKYKACALAAGVEIEGQDEELVRSMLKDVRVGAHVAWKVTAEGFIRANVTSWFKEGEKVAAVDEDAMKATREQAQAIQTSGGAGRGGSLPPRLANRAGAPLPPARAAFNAPPVTGRIAR
jgi:hypothetical protein